MSGGPVMREAVVAALSSLDANYRPILKQIGDAIGYGHAQSILGELWDEMLEAEYGFSGRGQLGVTIDDALPPLPKAAHKRRQQARNGCYRMVPAYTESEMKAYAHAAIRKAQGDQA